MKCLILEVGVNPAIWTPSEFATLVEVFDLGAKDDFLSWTETAALGDMWMRRWCFNGVSVTQLCAVRVSTSAAKVFKQTQTMAMRGGRRKTECEG